MKRVPQGAPPILYGICCQSYLTTVGKSSAEKMNKESKEVVMNILPREPSVTRPAM